MASITYYSIPELSRKLRSELSEAQFKELIKELVRNNSAEFSEYKRDSIPYANYAPVVKTCIACGRPI